MARPRKRKRPASTEEVPMNALPCRKKKKNGNQPLVNPRVQHPVLSQYYPQVQSLREYIVAKLPSSSRIRRKRISAVGIASKSPDTFPSDAERSLGVVLDTTLIGLSKPLTGGEDRIEAWKSFSQRGDESCVTLSNGVAGFAESQSLVSHCLPRHSPIRISSGSPVRTKWVTDHYPSDYRVCCKDSLQQR
jgi:hypothetical protein